MIGAVGPDMLLDSVDAFDRAVGTTVQRRDVFARKVNFRVAHVLLRNSQGELLVQQLASTRDRHPGLWGSSVAAYLFAGEDYETAARRRLRQELRIDPCELSWFGKLEMEDEGCTKFIGCFLARSDEKPEIADPSHIATLRFLDPSALVRLRASGEMRLTPTFELVLRAYLERGAV